MVGHPRQEQTMWRCTICTDRRTLNRTIYSVHLAGTAANWIKVQWMDGKWRKREKFPLASAAAWKHLYLPLAFVSWENSYIFFWIFLLFLWPPPPPLLWQRFSWCLHIRSLYRLDFELQSQNLSNLGQATKKLKYLLHASLALPFCWVNIKWDLSAGLPTAGHMYLYRCLCIFYLYMYLYLCATSCCVTVQWCVKHTPTSPQPNW